MASRKPFFICTDVVEKVTDFMESALPPADWVRFRVHLAHCSDCRRYLEQMKATVETCRHLGDAEPARPELPPRLREHFHAFRSARTKGKS